MCGSVSHGWCSATVVCSGCSVHQHQQAQGRLGIGHEVVLDRTTVAGSAEPWQDPVPGIRGAGIWVKREIRRCGCGHAVSC